MDLLNEWPSHEIIVFKSYDSIFWAGLGFAYYSILKYFIVNVLWFFFYEKEGTD